MDRDATASKAQRKKQDSAARSDLFEDKVTDIDSNVENSETEEQKAEKISVLRGKLMMFRQKTRGVLLSTTFNDTWSQWSDEEYLTYSNKSMDIYVEQKSEVDRRRKEVSCKYNCNNRHAHHSTP